MNDMPESITLLLYAGDANLGRQIGGAELLIDQHYNLTSVTLVSG